MPPPDHLKSSTIRKRTGNVESTAIEIADRFREENLIDVGPEEIYLAHCHHIVRSSVGKK